MPGATVKGSLEHRVPGNLNISFPRVEADALLARLPGVTASTGSACSAGAITPSRTLLAMGLPAKRIAGAVRFGVSRGSTPDQVVRATALVIAAVQTLTTEFAQ